MSRDYTGELDPNAPITEQASHWWVTLNAKSASAMEHRAFAEWVAKSPERVEAFLQTARITRALRSSDLHWPETSVEVLSREVAEAGDVVSLRSSWRGRMGRRRPATWLAVAATVLLMAAGAWTLFSRAQDFATGVGELRSVALSDHSIVTLNTASRIEVLFDRGHRVVRLVGGEALFQVARDPVRPFDVLVGDEAVRAVGTRFNVDKRASQTTVTVVEGKVAILSRGRVSEGGDLRSAVVLAQRETGKGGSQSDTTYLEAGEQVTLPAGRAAPERPHRTDSGVVTAWTQRRLIFDGQPLADVAEEFNRYNRQQIRIRGEGLGKQEITGTFQADDPESFLLFLSKIPGVRVERDAEYFDVVGAE